MIGVRLCLPEGCIDHPYGSFCLRQDSKQGNVLTAWTHAVSIEPRRKNDIIYTISTSAIVININTVFRTEDRERSERDPAALHVW